MLANEREAEVVPLACGVKVTVNGVDWPAVNVTGNEIPEKTNSLLLRLADVIVSVPPVVVKLPLSDELDPTARLPKLRVLGDTAS